MLSKLIHNLMEQLNNFDKFAAPISDVRSVAPNWGQDVVSVP